MKVTCPFCNSEVDVDPSNPYCPNCNSLIILSSQQATPQPPTPSQSPQAQPPVQPTPQITGIGRLYVVAKDGREELLEEIKDAEIVLGRERLKNYAWRDPGTISRIHVKFKKEGDKYYVYDEGSTNGTYIEGQDIRGKGKVELKDGTEIRLVNPDYPVIVLRFKKEVRS